MRLVKEAGAMYYMMGISVLVSASAAIFFLKKVWVD
jgi:hypothetical protein